MSEQTDCWPGVSGPSNGNQQGLCTFTRYTLGGLSWPVCTLTSGNCGVSDECSKLAKDNCYFCGDGPLQPKASYQWTKFAPGKGGKMNSNCTAVFTNDALFGLKSCLANECVSDFKIINSSSNTLDCVTPNGTRIGDENPVGFEVYDGGKLVYFTCESSASGGRNLLAHRFYVCPSGSTLINLQYIDGPACKCMASDSSVFGGATISDPIPGTWPSNPAFQ